MNSTITTCYYHHELIGWLKISATEDAVTNIEFVNKPSNYLGPSGHPVLARVVLELDNYFEGKSGIFTTPIHFIEGSKFRQMVWRELLKIPPGQTMSYAQVASAIGKPKAARAVGTANGKNPIPIIVPCHRVINSNGHLGGYSSGVELKKALIDHEKTFSQIFPLEVEAKLVIISESPWEIVSGLNELGLIGKFALAPIHKLHFKDFYFDLHDRSLTKRKWGLRLRRQEDGAKIALKGPGLELKDGSIERPELEMEWSQQALDKILKLMVKIGINIDSKPETGNGNVEKSLRSLGLTVIQERDTHRIVRKMYGTTKREPIGEFVIDQVSFFVGNKPFNHYEIEIESWVAPESELIQNSVQFLKLKFGDSLMPWKIDKLATVQIVSDLFRSGKLTNVVSGDLLTRSNYETIQNEFVQKF